MIISGSCLCGGVQYEILGELNDAAYCHCSMCRRTLGAAFGTYVRVNADEFRWLRWVSIVRIADRSNDRYYERVIDDETGNVLRECDEPRRKLVASKL